MYVVYTSVYSIFQSLARGGVSVDIIFEYMLEVKGEGHLCATLGQSFDVDTQGCVGAYQGWPSTRIELYAWYQLRKVKFCDGWLWSLKFVSSYLINYGTLLLYL